MIDEDRLVHSVRFSSTLALLTAVVLMLGHVALGWFPHAGSNPWYYPLTLSLQLFYILVQVWVFRMRQRPS